MRIASRGFALLGAPPPEHVDIAAGGFRRVEWLVVEIVAHKGDHIVCRAGIEWLRGLTAHVVGTLGDQQRLHDAVGAIERDVDQKTVVRYSGTDGLQTFPWREMDLNFRFRARSESASRCPKGFGSSPSTVRTSAACNRISGPAPDCRSADTGIRRAGRRQPPRCSLRGRSTRAPAGSRWSSRLCCRDRRAG